MGRTLDRLCEITLCTRDYPREVSLLVDGDECETLDEFVKVIVDQLKEVEGWEKFVNCKPAAK